MSDKLKEYIKSLITKKLDEESVSGDAGAYSTPFAFRGNKKGDNAATKAAEGEGYTKAKKPKKSKVVDYKELWKESDYDKASISNVSSKYSAASPSSRPSLYLQKSEYTAAESMKEALNKIIKEELLNEGSYSKFKKEVSFRTKSEQLHKAIREVKRKLKEIDRIVEYTSRMKQELSEDGGLNYWKATQNNINTISEMVNSLNNKIKNLN